MLGNLPDVEISEHNKLIINNITSMVDNRFFLFLCFSSRIRHHSQNAYLIENEKKKALSNNHKKPLIFKRNN